MLILLTAIVKIGFCCTCVQTKEFSIKTEFKYRDVIFHGKLIKIDTINVEIASWRSFSRNEIWYTFQVIEFFKGKSKEKTIRVKSGETNVADCKFVFTNEESYVVYAHYRLTEKFKKDKSILKTSVCTHTGEATEVKITEAKNQSKYR